MISKQDIVDAVRVRESQKRYLDYSSYDFFESIAGAERLAFYEENAHDGEMAVAHLWPDGSVSLMTDYFGTCGGCCSWEGASAETIKRLMEGCARNARIFPSEEAAKEFIRGDAVEDAFEFSHKACAGLLDDAGEWVED